MIYEGSRYENEQVLRVTDSAGLLHPAIYVRQNIDAQTFAFLTYIVQEGDRPDTLAWHFYDDPEMWWEIARANPEVFYPDGLVPGTVLRIPNG
jgi:nucleoid-associated protein YgaU